MNERLNLGGGGWRVGSKESPNEKGCGRRSKRAKDVILGKE